MILAVLAAALLSVLGHEISLDPSVGCQCDFVRVTSGWCPACSVGYIAGVRVSSFLLFEALDDEGHEVDPTTLECAACRIAAAANGICAEHGWGIANGRIYGSRLTYYLALGEFIGALPGAQAKHSGETGWCEQCRIGWIGPVLFQDEGVHRAAVREYRRFRQAVNMLDRCEMCGVALYYNGYCPECRISYRDGEPVSEGASCRTGNQ